MNWVEFLNDNHIEYVTRGPNTKRGEVSIRCPFCGEDDPSQHMGISLTAENWGCLRNPAHRGHAPAHLVGGILGVSAQQARGIVAQYSTRDPGLFGQIVSNPELSKPEPEIIPDLKPIKAYGSTAKFWRYLELRGFDPHKLIQAFDLQCCLTGPFKDRVMIPVYRNGEMVAWTGRALINPVTAPRYLSSKRIKEVIFNEDQLSEVLGDRILFVVEGPFDAMKLDHYGHLLAARATCTFGTSVSMDQAVLLNSLRHRFEKVVVLFDQGALEPAFMAMDWLHTGNVTLGQIPDGVKDPGELTVNQIHKLIEEQ